VSGQRRPVRPGGRREARERAIELAYEAEVRQITVDELLASLPLEPDRFTVELLRAEEQVRPKAEELIAARATGWSLDRMPVIDRIIMRLATAELLSLDTPTGVVLAEAVELATRYSTDESGRFVNGVLANVARDTRLEP
jgi:N utilization substance protein B